MHFIFGGRYMGKLDYAKTLFADPVVCDLAHNDASAMFSADIIRNIHLLVKDMLAAGQDPVRFFADNLAALEGKAVIGDEIGSGVVPFEPQDREWRDETGRVYQLLAGHARQVTRVWAGIPQVLKGGGAQR